MFLGRDIDDILTYKTPKLVKIRDRKLCIGRMAVILGVFVYVVIFAVIIQQGYLLREAPVGFSRMSVRSDNAGTTAGYCGAQSSSSGLNYKTLPCLPWSYRESVFPAAEEDSILLTSRATISTTTSTVANQDCYWNINACGSTVSNSTHYYVPGLDTYTILMAHAVYGVQNNVHYIEREMKEGVVENYDGKKLLDLTKERSNGNNNLPGDLFTVQQILDFAGVDLDAESSSSDDETTRYSGVIILCYIKYRSSKISLSDLKYKMRFVRIPGAEDKHEQTLYRQVTSTAGPVTQRMVINRHGVRIIVAQAGSVGKFSFQELLKTLVTAFALLSVANFFVDKILLRLLPLRSVYEAYKYTMSVDFSELKKDKVNNCYIADAKRGARGRPFPLEAHDFIYGTLLRGGKTGRPEWDIGQGPELAYRNYVMGEDGNPNLHSPIHSAKYPGMPSSNSIHAYPSPPHMAMGTPTPSPHNNQQLYTPIQMPVMPLLPQGHGNEAIHIAGMPHPVYGNTTVPEPAPLYTPNLHPRPM